MYHMKKFNGTYFIYFWVGQDKAINNDQQSRLFRDSFHVSKTNQIEWRESSKKNMIAPELLAYWEI